MNLNPAAIKNPEIPLMKENTSNELREESTDAWPGRACPPIRRGTLPFTSLKESRLAGATKAVRLLLLLCGLQVSLGSNCLAAIPWPCPSDYTAYSYIGANGLPNSTGYCIGPDDVNPPCIEDNSVA